MGNYKTVFKSASSELIIEKSRFIGYCQPIESEQEALAFIESIKKRHWDATHNVPVYVLGARYEVQRYSDDGEPTGTAGQPILSMLKNEGITNVAVVITRYFGGIKLGTGGLVRAYTQAAKAGLEAAVVIDRLEKTAVSVSLPYTLHGKAQNHLMAEEQVLLHETHFAEAVTIEFFVSPEHEGSVKAKLTDLTSGQMEWQVMGIAMLSVSEGVVLEKDFL